MESLAQDLRPFLFLVTGVILGGILGLIGYQVSTLLTKNRTTKTIDLETPEVITTGTDSVDCVLSIADLEKCWSQAEKDAPNVEDEWVLFGKYVANLAANQTRMHTLQVASEGSPDHRKWFILNELAKIFPEEEQPIMSDPPELRYLKAIRELKVDQTRRRKDLRSSAGYAASAVDDTTRP